MTFRLSASSTLEKDGVQYQSGDLSLFPNMRDDFDSLYRATNNSQTKLRQSLPYNGNNIVVDSTDGFPDTGLLRIGQAGVDLNFELLYYGNKNSNTFYNLARGFAGSTQQQWPIGTSVTNSVQATPHNATKDAILNIENYIGPSINPPGTSLNGILTALENKYLAPKPTFQAFPVAGIAPLTVRFQNFSNSESIRFLWDFGDGATSEEKSPTHTYLADGLYTVQLNMVMSTGAQGSVVKTNYINVSETEVTPFFYAKEISIDLITHSALYEFVDQTDGDIKARYWVFGDGTSISETDPYIHTIRHTYAVAGTYSPSLLIVFSSNLLKRVFLQQSLVVI